MQTDKKSVIESIYRAIDAINMTRPSSDKLRKTPQTELNDSLDSMGLVNLIVETEMIIEEEFGQTVNLADQKAASQPQIYTSVESLASYIESQLSSQP